MIVTWNVQESTGIHYGKVAHESAFAEGEYDYLISLDFLEVEEGDKLLSAFMTIKHRKLNAVLSQNWGMYYTVEDARKRALYGLAGTIASNIAKLDKDHAGVLTLMSKQ